MSNIVLKKQTSASIDTPATDKVTIFVDSADWKMKNKNESGAVENIATEEYISNNSFVLSNSWYLAWESIGKWDSLYVSVWASDWWRTSGRLYKTQADNVLRLPVIPMISSWNYGVWETVSYDFQWISKSLTWLIDSLYFISNTPWAISTVAWTNKFCIGEGLNGNLALNKTWLSYVSASDTSLATSAVFTRTTNNTFQLVQTFTVSKYWTYRVKWNMINDNSSNPNTAVIYRNWVSYWVWKSVGGAGSEQTVSDDLVLYPWDTYALYHRNVYAISWTYGWSSWKLNICWTEWRIGVDILNYIPQKITAPVIA